MADSRASARSEHASGKSGTQLIRLAAHRATVCGMPWGVQHDYQVCPTCGTPLEVEYLVHELANGAEARTWVARNGSGVRCPSGHDLPPYQEIQERVLAWQEDHPQQS